MKKLTILALIVVLASPALALSQKDKKQGKAKGKEQSSDVQVTVVFGQSDRDATHAYYQKKYGAGNCPPGLAKKNNGCLPPGQAKKRYQIGHPLPREVVYIEPPHDLMVTLRPAPAGYKYVVVDGDLVKLALGTMLVVDAIDGLFH